MHRLNTIACMTTRLINSKMRIRGTEFHFKFLFRILIMHTLTDISFISRSLRGIGFSNISASYLRPSTLQLASSANKTSKIATGSLLASPVYIPSSSSKSCASIIKIVHVAYVRTQNHLQRESLEYSFPCIRLIVISLEFADVSRMFLAVDFNDDSRSYERGTTVTPQSVSIPRYNHESESEKAIKT